MTSTPLCKERTAVDEFFKVNHELNGEQRATCPLLPFKLGKRLRLNNNSNEKQHKSKS